MSAKLAALIVFSSLREPQMNEEEVQVLVRTMCAAILVVTGVMLFATNRKEISNWAFVNVLSGNDSIICRPDCR